MREFYITDCEVAPNFFCCTFLNYKNDVKHIFTIHEGDLSQLEPFCSFWNNCKKNHAYIVTFNGNHYDIPIYEKLFDLFTNHKKGHGINFSLYEFSKLIINTDFWWKNEDGSNNQNTRYKYVKGIISIDLYLYWSRMLRLSKKISLKSLAIQLKYHTVQELPYDPDKILQEKDFDKVIHYNSVHDINITKMLCEKLKDQIKLRAEINQQYGLFCYSWDGPKIGMNLLRNFYKKKYHKKLSIYKYYDTISLNDIILPEVFFKKEKGYTKFHKKKIVFNTNYDLLNHFNSLTVSSSKEISARVLLKQNNDMILVSDFGSGGIHGVAFNGVLEPKKDELIIDIDASSYYPSLIETLKCLGEVLPIYSKMKEDRIKAKKEGNKVISDTYKLCLNSVYGMLGNKFSGIQNIKDQLSITVNGQLILQMLTEKIMETGASVVYQNTDGITVLCKKTQEYEIKQICKSITDIFPKIIWEYEYFKKMIIKDVNNFLNITTDGKIKRKGLFVYNKQLGDSVDFLIIPKALSAYFVEGIKPEEFVKNHNDIHDFCSSKKVAKKFEVWWGNKKQQQLNRFYVSKKGKYLFRKDKYENKFHHLLKDSGVQLYNNVGKEFPKDIDYSWYIKKIYDIIYEIQPLQLKLF